MINVNPSAAKLTYNQVLDIYRLCKSGKNTMEELAEKYQVSLSTIQRIVHGMTWKQLELAPLKKPLLKPVWNVDRKMWEEVEE